MPAPPVVLNYHGIADLDVGHDPVRLFVPPRRFRRQVSSLKKRGYRFLNVSEFVTALATGGDLDHICALSFDDGSEDNHSVLVPILEEMEVPATIYVCPGMLGERYPWLSPESGMRIINREELDALASHPLIEIGSHTVRHTSLGEATAEQAYDEMSRSKAMLEDMLGVEVPSFCYPGCLYSPPCPDAARRAGHTSAVTCGPRGSHDPFQLQRESLHRNDGALIFGMKARGLYYGTRDIAPVRAVRKLTRPIRHAS